MYARYKNADFCIAYLADIHREDMSKRRNMFIAFPHKPQCGFFHASIEAEEPVEEEIITQFFET